MATLTIEQETGLSYSSSTFAVYRYDEYPRGSVLEGQVRRHYVEGGFRTIDAAQERYPEADVSGPVAPRAEVPPVPPVTFDPGYAGESWDEQD